MVKQNNKLLISLLPKKVVEHFEIYNKYPSNTIKKATVCFTDFVNFTSSTKGNSPETIVKSLEFYFNYFDEVVSKNNLTRLKTIGDGYMFVSGAPVEYENCEKIAIKTAIEILDFVKSFNPPKELLKFNIRIGLATGEIMTAVIGKEKISYDIWSETVNLAARLESNSIENRIVICKNTQKAIKDSYKTEFYCRKPLKGFNDVDLYIIST